MVFWWNVPRENQTLDRRRQEKVGIILKDTLPNRSRWADIEAKAAAKRAAKTVAWGSEVVGGDWNMFYSDL